MPRLLRQQGYVSQLICDCPHLFKYGFEQAFTAAEVLRGQEGDLSRLRMNHPIETVMPPEKTRTGRYLQGHNLLDMHRWQHRNWKGEMDCFPPRTAQAAVEFLEENYLHDPFLLWVDFFDPHEPWDAPEYMVRKYDPDYTGTPMLHPNYGMADDLTEGELRNLRAHYCAEAEFVDRWVGRILEKIDDLNLWSNSIVVFTTDHGISLGEHNRTGKLNVNERDSRFWPLYPEIAHIPFLVTAPGLEGGRSVSGFAQPVDIFPTLLDLAGVDVSPEEPFQGRSFAPMLKGQRDDTDTDYAICGSHLRPSPDGTIPAEATTPVLYTEQWAYAPIGPDGQKQLFDLTADPYGETDVASDNPDVVQSLHRRLLDRLEQLDAPSEAMALLKEAQ